VLGAADKVFESEELPTRLVDQLPGPLKVSLMVGKIWLVVTDDGFPVELVRFQLGEWTSVPWVMLLEDFRAFGIVVFAGAVEVAGNGWTTLLDVLLGAVSLQRLGAVWLAIDPELELWVAHTGPLGMACAHVP
jgi:hypothetical protein